MLHLTTGQYTHEGRLITWYSINHALLRGLSRSGLVEGLVFEPIELYLYPRLKDYLGLNALLKPVELRFEPEFSFIREVHKVTKTVEVWDGVGFPMEETFCITCVDGRVIYRDKRNAHLMDMVEKVKHKGDTRVVVLNKGLKREVLSYGAVS